MLRRWAYYYSLLHDSREPGCNKSLPIFCMTGSLRALDMSQDRRNTFAHESPSLFTSLLVTFGDFAAWSSVCPDFMADLNSFWTLANAARRVF